MSKGRQAADGKILLVAADDAVCRSLADSAELNPWRLMQAASGEQLLELLASEPVDVVLVDVDSTGGGGSSTLARLRQHYPELPLITTGSMPANDDHDPGVMHLPAPVEPLALLAALDALDAPTMAFHRLVTGEEMARDHLEDLLLIRQVAEAAQTSADLPSFLEELVSRIMSAARVRHCSLMLCRPDGHLEIAAARGLPAEVITSTLIKPGEGIAGHVLATGEPILIPNLETCERFDLVAGVDRYLTRSLLSVPLLSRGQVHGVLNVNNKEDGSPFSAIDLHLLSGVAHQAILAIENFRLVAEQQQSSLELEATNRRLQQLLKARSRLVCNLSHELKTPLTSVLGYVDLALNHFEEIEAGELHAYLQRVRDEGLQIEKLINNMLTLFSLESGSGRWDWEEVDPAVELRRQVDARRQDVAGLGLKFKLKIETTSVLLRADRSRLSFLLAALLDNAIKFNRRGGRLEVFLCDLPCGGRQGVEIRMFNEGARVPPEAAEQIFDQYTQLGDIQSGKPAGIGVGLAICRAIVDRFGGLISLLPNETSGTTVAIWLPTDFNEDQHEEWNSTPGQGL